MDSAHRKIELQSPEDLAFLIGNVRRAATEHVTAAFPPVGGQEGAGEDELRVRIEKLVEDYISQTFTLAAPNLSINGFDLDPDTFPSAYLSSPPDDPSSPGARRRRRLGGGEPSGGEEGGEEGAGPEVQYEPFDARRRARVEELARAEEDLVREIAALKRRVPAAAAGAYSEGFRAGVGADEEALARARDRAAALAATTTTTTTTTTSSSSSTTGGPPLVDGEEEGRAGGGDDKAVVGASAAAAVLGGVGPLERQDDVERSYGALVGTLSRLKRDMPATVAKMERARVAGQYVVTER